MLTYRFCVDDENGMTPIVTTVGHFLCHTKINTVCLHQTSLFRGL